MLAVAEEFFSTVDALGIPESSLPNISRAIQLSTTAIERARAVLRSHELFGASGLTLVVFGSMARYELTVYSDLDYLLITDRARAPCREELVEAVDELRSGLIDGVVFDLPKIDGAFGTTVDLDQIITRIGLQSDDNCNLTRRMLLLEEAVYLTESRLRRDHLKRMLEQYGAPRKPGPRSFPRALVHDIVRYWRTVAVDDHAKSARDTFPYSRRYLKLLIPRKLSYISSLAPLFLFCSGEEYDYVAFLADAFMQPPIVRLARLLADISDPRYPDSARLIEIARSIFAMLDQFIARSGDLCWRATIERECRGRSPHDASAFGDMRRLGNELHSQVAELLLSNAMVAFTKEYLLV